MDMKITKWNRNSEWAIVQLTLGANEHLLSNREYYPTAVYAPLSALEAKIFMQNHPQVENNNLPNPMYVAMPVVNLEDMGVFSDASSESETNSSTD